MLLRPILLSLSSMERVRDLAMSVPLGRKMASRFVAGEGRADAIAAIRTVNDEGMVASLDYLGENVEDVAQARAMVDEYRRVLDEIAAAGARSNVSVKLTALGLDLDEDVCIRHIEQLCDHAREHGNFVRLDMEGSPYTESTLRVYERLRDDGHDNVGVVLQAYLHRTEDDVQRLMERGGLSVRLCKGAYQETSEIAFQGMPEIRRNFARLARLLSSDGAIGRVTCLALATHDPKLIRWGRKLFAERDGKGPPIEFQMLYGIRRDIQGALADAGLPLRIYIPYGEAWYGYFMRRLAERWENVAFVLRSLLSETGTSRTRRRRRRPAGR